MKKKIVVLLICVLSLSLLFACSESYKVKAIATDMSNLTVTSNGGLSVKVANANVKYLYYINGYAGNTVDNAFGEVQKGAIARVELDDNDKPIASTNMLIVKKNVYNTTKTSGLYVVGNYIYYSTPSIDKNKEGEPKTDQMHLMRTKLDGTDTAIIKKFTDYTPVYKVVDGYILYTNAAGELHQINLNSKKFDDKQVDKEISGPLMTKYSNDTNAFINTVFYLKASAVKGQTHNVIWAYSAGSQKPVKLIDGNVDSYPANRLEHPSGLTFALVQAMYVGDNIRLFYTKTDNGSNKTSSGTYSYDFTADDFTQDLKFKYENEKRYSFGADNNYTTFIKFLNNDNVLAMLSSNVVLLSKTGSGWSHTKLIETTVSEVLDVKEIDERIVVFYSTTSEVFSISVLTVESDNTFTPAIRTAQKLMATAYNSTWLTFDKVGEYFYFFNSSVSDYTYYIKLIDVNAEVESTKLPTLLGLVTEADKIALIS